jgi:cytochrome P450 family 138
MARTVTKLPPGPRMPKLAHGYVFFRNRVDIMKRLQGRYGDAFTMNLPILGPSVIICSPELIKQTYTASSDVLRVSDNNTLGELFGPGSLFSMDGKEHLRERKLLLPPFHGTRVQTYRGVIEEETIRGTASWPEGKEFATMASFMRITLNVILRAVFGAEGPRQERLAALLPGLVTTGSLLAGFPFLHRDFGRRSPAARYARLRNQYDEVVDELIDEALSDPELDQRADVLALLLGAHYEDGSSMSRSAIADELLTLLAAGHETTATTLAWAIERLRRHPILLRRLTQEAEGDGKELLAATITEVQRTRPVIIQTDRYVVVDGYELGEWRIPKGYRIVQMASLTHNDARFFERPQEFDPDRFLDGAPGTYVWIPFGGGTRRCIGAAFAQMEMSVVLRTLLREFDFVTTSDRDERQRSRGVAFAPAGGGRAVVHRSRRSQATAEQVTAVPAGSA